MAERESIYVWSTSAAGNGNIDASINFQENQLPGTLNNSNRAVLAAAARYIKDINGTILTSGAVNAYVATTSETWSAHSSGHLLGFKAHSTNTGSVTLSVINADGSVLGSKAIRGPGDVALSAGQIVASAQYDVRYDASGNGAVGAWMLLNPTVAINGQSGTIALPSTPGGRLTLTSGTAVTEADVTAATSIYYTPAVHDQIEIYDGSNFVAKTFAELTLALHSTHHYQIAQFDVFVAVDSGSPIIGTGPFWSKTSTVTMTIASPCVVSWASHGLSVGQPIIFTTTGALPTGITAGTTYFIISAGYGANDFQISATLGGSAVNTTGSQSGTHTAVAASDTTRGTGAGTTETEVYKGRMVNKNTLTALRNGSTTYSVAARQATLVGGVRCTAAGQTEDSFAKRFVSNAFNAEVRPMRVLEVSSSWALTLAAGVRIANGSTANAIEWFHCVSGRITETMSHGETSSARFVSSLVSLDSITVRAPGSRFSIQPSAAFATVTGDWRGYAGLGRHYSAWLEQTFIGDTVMVGDDHNGIIGWTLN